MNDKTTDEKLKLLLSAYEDSERLTKHIFNYCETKEDRQKMIEFIESKNPSYGKVCEYSAVIAIEAGTAEGELEDAGDGYWD